MDDLKVIDAHTHFKEKFLKVLTKREIGDYLGSGVEYSIGVVDFFPIDWEKAITEIAVLLHCFIEEKYHAGLEIDVIENLLWEEVDYDAGKINARKFDDKLVNKIFNTANIRLKTLMREVDRISNFALPSDAADRFIKNTEEEITALKAIRKMYGLKTYLCVGVHPLAIKTIGDFDSVKKVLRMLEDLLRNCSYVIGVGECGIENNTTIEKKTLFEILSLAKKLKVPVVMHTPLTHGKIPADRKLKGIADACRIVKASGIDIDRVAFDHITDLECIKVITKAFPKDKPYLSFSIQGHWISAKKAAALISQIQAGWRDRIMVNSDFGTYQTPRAFALLKRHFQARRVSADTAKKALYENALRFFNLSGLKNGFQNKLAKRYSLIADFSNVDNRLDALFGLKMIRDRLMPAYGFKKTVLAAGKWTNLLRIYAKCAGMKDIKICPSRKAGRRSISLDMARPADAAHIYDGIENGIKRQVK